ncbi:MAG: KH domain-containing protein [Chloroflexi bacterium]|nr:KH domain-containing protein [Chloroflexota bacterium]
MELDNLVAYIARALVEHPDQVEVNADERGGAITLELYVAQGDMGRVIGKGGRIANAMRTLVRVAAMREGKRVSLDVVTRVPGA